MQFKYFPLKKKSSLFITKTYHQVFQLNFLRIWLLSPDYLQIHFTKDVIMRHQNDVCNFANDELTRSFKKRHELECPTTELYWRLLGCTENSSISIADHYGFSKKEKYLSHMHHTFFQNGTFLQLILQILWKGPYFKIWQNRKVVIGGKQLSPLIFNPFLLIPSPASQIAEICTYTFHDIFLRQWQYFIAEEEEGIFPMIGIITIQ